MFLITFSPNGNDDSVDHSSFIKFNNLSHSFIIFHEATNPDVIKSVLLFVKRDTDDVHSVN